MTRRNPDTVARARELRARGISYRQIAEKLGVAEGTIRNWLRDAQLIAEPPPPAEPRTLVDELAALATALDAADAATEANVCRRAAAALRTTQARPQTTPMPEPGDDMRAYVVDLIRWVQGQVSEAAEMGNQQTVKQLVSTIEKLARLDKQLADLEPQDTDAVVVPRAKLDQAAAKFTERMATLAAQPLTCSVCGAELRMHLALRGAGVAGSLAG